jgi:hypothetical protein
MRPAQFGFARIFAHPRAYLAGQNASARIARSQASAGPDRGANRLVSRSGESETMRKCHDAQMSRREVSTAGVAADRHDRDASTPL